MRVLVAALLLVLTACAPASPVTPRAASRAWQTHLDERHPLVGKIWSVRDARFVDEAALLAALDGPILLGEKHDNPDHHALQAELLAAVAAKRPVVAFEMLDREDQAAIDGARRAAPHEAAAIAAAVHWDTSGWPPFAMYAPVVQAALDRDLPIVAAGISRKAVFAAARGEAPALEVGAPLAPEAEGSLAEELRASHCGKLPEAALPKMIAVQRARDVAMAKALAAAPQGVLVAGAGHTRKDRGVGRELSRSVSVAFVEVESGKTEPAAYAPRFHATTLPYDFVWFTPRANDDDPCAGM